MNLLAGPPLGPGIFPVRPGLEPTAFLGASVSQWTMGVRDGVEGSVERADSHSLVERITSRPGTSAHRHDRSRQMSAFPESGRAEERKRPNLGVDGRCAAR
jgi:hypothetical protein